MENQQHQIWLKDHIYPSFQQGLVSMSRYGNHITQLNRGYFISNKYGWRWNKSSTIGTFTELCFNFIALAKNGLAYVPTIGVPPSSSKWKLQSLSVEADEIFPDETRGGRNRLATSRRSASNTWIRTPAWLVCGEMIGAKRGKTKWLFIVFVYRFSGWWFGPLWKIWVNWDDEIPNIWENKRCSKPPTSFHRSFSYNYQLGGKLWWLCIAMIIPPFPRTSKMFEKCWCFTNGGVPQIIQNSSILVLKPMVTWGLSIFMRNTPNLAFRSLVSL